jgi:hypothetical protein
MKEAGFWIKVMVSSLFLATAGAMIFLTLFGRSVVPKVHADKSCTVAAAAGTYGFVASGSIAGVGPVAVTGLLSSDRTGNLVANETQKIDGATTILTVTGTLTVNSDCSFTNSFSDGSTAAGVIVDGGREVDFIETFPEALGFTGVAKRVKDAAD